jgi:hypothetical protein
MYTTWITIKDGIVDDVCQIAGDTSPGDAWKKVPNDWNGNPKDDLAWFDSDMCRIPDIKLVEKGVRKDNRGVWYNKKTKERKNIYSMDEDIDTGWTREAPPENEFYLRWEEASGAWIVDVERKGLAEKNQIIAEKKFAIEDAERRIQRSVRAKLDGTATAEDEQYFTQLSAEINLLREELKHLTLQR